MHLPIIHFNARRDTSTVEISTKNEAGDLTPIAHLRVKGLTQNMAKAIVEALSTMYGLGAQNMAIALGRDDVRMVQIEQDPAEALLEELRTFLSSLGKQI